MWWSLLLMALAILFIDLENKSRIDGLFGCLSLVSAIASVAYAFLYVPNGIYIVGLVVICFLAFLIWRFF